MQNEKKDALLKLAKTFLKHQNKKKILGPLERASTWGQSHCSNSIRLGMGDENISVGPTPFSQNKG